MDNSAPFYLGINHTNVSRAGLPGMKWFQPIPMGINELNSIMKDCAQLAGKDKRITNQKKKKKH